MPFYDFAFSLSRQLMKNGTQKFSYVSEELLSSKFWYKNNMVLAIPAGMGQASKLRHSSSLYECYQASLEELCQTPAKGQTFSSRTGQTSGLPIELYKQVVIGAAGEVPVGSCGLSCR